MTGGDSPAPEGPSPAARLIDFLGRQPRWRVTALGVALLAGLWIVDRVTAPDLSFLVFYLGPVLLLTWFVGRRAGMLISLASAVLWFLDDVLTGSGTSLPFIRYWNAGVKLGFFLLVVQILTSLKVAIERQKLAEQERFEWELAMARQVQMRLFPQKLPPIATLDYNGFCRPAAAVGGDYYDFISLGPEKLGIAIGDISGKGLPASLLMASLQASLRSRASLSEDDQARTIQQVNRQLCALTDESRFATLFFGLYDGGRRELAYVNAGHNRPMLLRAAAHAPEIAEKDVERLTEGGTVLGLFPGAVFRQSVVTLAPGDLIGLFSDGVTEATDGAEVEFGEARLEVILRRNSSLSPGDLCESVFAEVREYLAGRPAPDDQTIVVLKVR